MKSVISEKLKEFIKREILVQVDNLPITTEIEKDLGITGDDAIDFINAFGAEFGVDISGYDVSEHFRSEGFYIPDSVRRFFLGDSFQKKSSVTLWDLELAITNKKL